MTKKMEKMMNMNCKLTNNKENKKQNKKINNTDFTCCFKKINNIKFIISYFTLYK